MLEIIIKISSIYALEKEGKLGFLYPSVCMVFQGIAAFGDIWGDDESRQIIGKEMHMAIDGIRVKDIGRWYAIGNKRRILHQFSRL